MTGRKSGIAVLEDYPLVLTTEQVCEILQINRKTLYKMVESGILPGRKSGKGYKISRDQVIAHLNGQKGDAK